MRRPCFITPSTHTDDVAGETVVQRYVHHRLASRVRPVRELKGFNKIALPAGECLQLTRQQLVFTGTTLSFGAEPGPFDVWITNSSVNGTPAQFEFLATKD